MEKAIDWTSSTFGFRVFWYRRLVALRYIDITSSLCVSHCRFDTVPQHLVWFQGMQGARSLVDYLMGPYLALCILP